MFNQLTSKSFFEIFHTLQILMNVTILADHPLWSKCNLNVIFSDGYYLIKCENLILSEMLNIRRQKILNNIWSIQHLNQLREIWHREAILERVRDRVHNWFNLFLDLSLSSLDLFEDFDILDNLILIKKIWLWMVYDEMNGFMFSDAVNLSGFLNLSEMAENLRIIWLHPLCHVPCD